MLKIKTITTRELLDNYYDPEKYLALCRACKNYGQNYACPPLAIEPKSFILTYDYAHIFLRKVDLNTSWSKEEALENYGQIKEKFVKDLVDYEKALGACVALVPGGCTRCSPCKRSKKLICPEAQEMRYNISAFSLSSVNLAHDLFALDLTWFEDKKPESLSLVGALMANKKLVNTEREGEGGS